MRTGGAQYDQLLITGGVKKLKPGGDCESENPIADPGPLSATRPSSLWARTLARSWSPLRLAVFGAGGMGATHASAYVAFGSKERVEVAGIVSRSAAKARRLAKRDSGCARAAGRGRDDRRGAREPSDLHGGSGDAVRRGLPARAPGGRIREARETSHRRGSAPRPAVLVRETTSAVPRLRRTDRRALDPRFRRRELDLGPTALRPGGRRIRFKRGDRACDGRGGVSGWERLHRGIRDDAAGLSVHDRPPSSVRRRHLRPCDRVPGRADPQDTVGPHHGTWTRERPRQRA